MSSPPRLLVHAPPDVLVLFVITDHPADFPTGYVLRARIIRGGSDEPGPAWTGPTLESVRALVPEGYMKIPKHPYDDPVIAETWV